MWARHWLEADRYSGECWQGTVLLALMSQRGSHKHTSGDTFREEKAWGVGRGSQKGPYMPTSKEETFQQRLGFSEKQPEGLLGWGWGQGWWE